MFSSLLPPPKVPGKQIPKINTARSGPKIGHLLAPSATDLTTTSQASSTTLTRKGTASSRTISNLHLNKDGSLNYSQTIALASNPARSAHTAYEDTIPLKVRYPNLKHYFPKPTEEETQECIEETRDVINNILSEKMGKKSTSGAGDGTSDVTYVKYESKSLINNNETAEGAEDEGERPRGRVLQIRELKEDPMLPPKFKLRKNRHKDPSPPPPILKKQSTAAPLTKEEQQKWSIPSAISNWKNNQGFTISLEKRMLAANGGTIEDDTAALNIEKFGDLSQALEDADKQAREDITIRNNLMRELALKEQQEKEQMLRDLAEQSRRERHKRPSDSHGNDYKRSRN